MKKSRLLNATWAYALFAFMPLAQAAVVEVGDLNIITDVGNPSDGLRFLDMTYSNGFTLAGAILNAQATYANVRAATPAEFDDLFVAAGIKYDNTSTASDAFAPGPGEIISTSDNYDGGQLSRDLGSDLTGGKALFWTDPDADAAVSSTRDYMILSQLDARIIQVALQPPIDSVGWLLVSDVTPVPLPAAVWLMGSGLLGLIGVARRKKA